jgi:hypothetical protein
MATKTLTITIDPETAEVETDLNGYQGNGCHAIQEVFAKAFGGKTIESRKKVEYHKGLTSKVCITR